MATAILTVFFMFFYFENKKIAGKKGIFLKPAGNNNP